MCNSPRDRSVYEPPSSRIVRDSETVSNRLPPCFPPHELSKSPETDVSSRPVSEAGEGHSILTLEDYCGGEGGGHRGPCLDDQRDC